MSLDVAIMLLTRAKALDSVEVARFSLIDSSPLAGHDWIWSQYTEIKVDDLVPTLSAFCSLARGIAEYVRQTDEADAEADGGTGLFVWRSRIASLPNRQ